MPSVVLIHVPRYLGNLPYRVWKKMLNSVQKSKSGDDRCCYMHGGRLTDFSIDFSTVIRGKYLMSLSDIIHNNLCMVHS